jgi:succinate dehydrogenase / fumarate reductase cytochrome b subunit
MLISILHRATGDGLAIVGGLGLTWWLYAAANGAASYANFIYYVWEAGAGDLVGLIANVIARIVLIGLSWAFFQHLFSGLRHLVMDMGAGYELQANGRWSKIIIAASLIATALLWAYLLLGSAH